MSLAEQWSLGHRMHASEKESRVENALKCLRIYKDMFSLTRVVDLGCGIGGWIRAAEMLGASEIVGYEGEWIRAADTIVSQEFIRIADLSKPMKLNKRYDLALSIEVAEHLPAEAADVYIDTLVGAADRIIFSAALPGQGGIGHLNEQPLAYWVEIFWRKRFVPVEFFRPFIAEDRSIYPWLRKNMIMFISYAGLIRSPELFRFARPIDDFALRYPCPPPA